MKKVLSALWLFLLSGLMALQAQSPESEKTYTGGLAFHIGMTQRGGGVGADFLLERNRINWVIGTDIYYQKDGREGPTTSFFGSDQGRDYVYGKLNHLFVLSPTVGIQKTLLGHRASRLMEVVGGISAGPALGFTSPYYLEIFEPIAGNPLLGNKVVQAYNPATHGYSRIIGRASIFDSRWNLNVNPGLSLRAHTWFDLDHSPGGISGIRLAFQGDWYFTSPDIFSEEVLQLENRQFFPSIALGFLFGNRW